MKIEYQLEGGEIDKELDETVIEHTFEQFGLDHDGSGYEYKTKIRDLYFYLKK